MKKRLIFNWKNYFRSSTEIEQWFLAIESKKIDFKLQDFAYYLAVSEMDLRLCAQLLQKYELPFILTSQHLPESERVPSTGLANIKSLESLVRASIIGHSEERILGLDSKEILSQLNMAHKYEIESFLCVSKESEILEGADFICFEPLEAIGSGHSATFERIGEFLNSLPINYQAKMLYGGSIDGENVAQILNAVPGLVGVLVGHASINADEVKHIIEKC